MVKSDPKKKRSTATQTIPETLKDGTESPSGTETSGDTAASPGQMTGAQEERDLAASPGALGEDYSSASDSQLKGGEDSSASDLQLEGGENACQSDKLKDTSNQDQEEMGPGSEEMPPKTDTKDSDDEERSSATIVSPVAVDQSAPAIYKETIAAVNTDVLHMRTIVEDQYESHDGMGEKGEVVTESEGTERQEMEGGCTDEGDATVGEESVGEFGGVSGGEDTGSSTGGTEIVGGSGAECGDADADVKKKPMMVRIPYGGDEDVDVEWMALDHRVVQFMDDGESSISTFSDEDEEIVQAMHASGKPLKGMKRIENHLEAMMKGKQHSQSKSPPKAERDGHKSKKVGIRLPTDEASGGRKADYTSHGITSLPPQLFKAKDAIQELLIAGNNIRFIQPDIKRLTNLVKIDVSKNGIRSNSPNDFGGLPLEMQELKSLQQLIASECNFRYVPPVIWKIPSLKHLDVSRNKIHVLPPDVGNLFKLEILNLQQTNIVTLPPEIVYCEALTELLLWGNAMESLPETMVELTKLHTLKINNRSFAQLVVQDAYMENLLRKGQIQSEHIPQVLFEIPELKVIDLEECLINNIPQKCQTAVTEVYLQKNFFHSFPNAILEMVSLTTLNLSSNFLTVIPNGIDSVTNIETLKFNSNKITKIPKTISKLSKLLDFQVGDNQINVLPPELCELKNLQRLFVYQNKIKELPENINRLSSLETFDLTANELRSLPLDMYKMTGLKTAHTYQHYQKSGLWLHKNPLKSPPEQIWKTENPQKIWTHLRRQQIIQTENLQRQKIIVLGDYQAGKTSFIHALVQGKSVLTVPVKDSTSVMSETRWKTDNNVQFIILELGGDANYRIIHPLFLDEKALYIIVYDHRSYTSAKFQRAIGQWIDLLQMHVPGAVVKIVGTQSDLCSGDFYEKNEGLAKADLENHLREHRSKVKVLRESAKTMMGEERGEDATVGHSRKQLKVQKKKAEMIVKNQLKVVSNITITHSNEGTPDVEDIINDLETMVINKNLFPDAQRIIPKHWTQFRAKLNMHPGRCVTMDTVRQLADNFKITDPKELEASLHFFQDTGDIIWYSRSPVLKDIIFHVPGHLVELIQCLYRHDLKDYMNYQTNRVFASRGMFDETAFNQAKEDFFQSGQISRPLLRCLWFYIKITYDQFADMVNLVPKLDLFYYVPQPDIPTTNTYRDTLAVMPWYNKDIQPNDVSDLWPVAVPEDQTEMQIKYTFPVHYPESAFEKFSVRLQDHVISRIDWQDMLYATTEGESILVKRLLDLNTYDLQIVINVRGDLEGTRTLIGQLYVHMKELLETFHGLLWLETFEVSNASAPLEVCFPQDVINL